MSDSGPDGSVTQWIHALRGEDAAERVHAQTQIFRRYWSELRVLVMARLDQRIQKRESPSDLAQKTPPVSFSTTSTWKTVRRCVSC